MDSIVNLLTWNIDTPLTFRVVMDTPLGVFHRILSVIGLLSTAFAPPTITTRLAVRVLGTIPAHQLGEVFATFDAFLTLATALLLVAGGTLVAIVITAFFAVLVAWKLPTTATASISAFLKITSTIHTGKLQHFATSSSNRRHSYSSFGLIIIIGN
jgi:hypothetical protein